MLLLVDTREHWTHPGSTDTHIKGYLVRHGVDFEIRKLDVGDYQVEGRPFISVDRKQNLEELSRNLMNKSDKSRFWREVRRAHAQHIRLVVLCEHGGQIKTLEDVKYWKSKYSPVSGRRLIDEMIRVEMAYGVVWRFCGKRSTAKKILEILYDPKLTQPAAEKF